MKRYVTELANDIINRDNENDLMRTDVKKQRKASIEHIVELCRDGFITDVEAVYQISSLNI